MNFAWVNKVKWFQLLLCITNNSIKHQSFVFTQLNDLTLPQLNDLTLHTIKWSNTSLFAHCLNVRQFYLILLIGLIVKTGKFVFPSVFKDWLVSNVYQNFSCSVYLDPNIYCVIAYLISVFWLCILLFWVLCSFFFCLVSCYISQKDKSSRAREKIRKDKRILLLLLLLFQREQNA